MDVGTRLFRLGDRIGALRLLSTIVEIEINNPNYLRALAYKLEELGELEYAINLYERILKLRYPTLSSFSDVPDQRSLNVRVTLIYVHSTAYRDLAVCLCKRKKAESYQRALELLSQVAQGNWDIRFTQIEAIAIMVIDKYD